MTITTPIAAATQRYWMAAEPDCRDALEARMARTPYSTKWAVFLIAAWMSRNVSGGADGKKNSMSGLIKRDVWAIEPGLLPKTRITAAHNIKGAYAKKRSRLSDVTLKPPDINGAFG
jgi:hypothetical protein